MSEKISESERHTVEAFIETVMGVPPSELLDGTRVSEICERASTRIAELETENAELEADNAELRKQLAEADEVIGWLMSA